MPQRGPNRLVDELDGYREWARSRSDASGQQLRARGLPIQVTKEIVEGLVRQGAPELRIIDFPNVELTVDDHPVPHAQLGLAMRL